MDLSKPTRKDRTVTYAPITGSHRQPCGLVEGRSLFAEAPG
jgi:hypothetical protein